MKIIKPRAALLSHNRSNQRGAAVLIVLIILAIIGILLYANTRTLWLLKEELRLLNAKQLIKYEQRATH